MTSSTWSYRPSNKMATLRKLQKTMLIPWMTLVTGLSVIGGVDGQSIIKHPKDVTGTVGGTADFTCQVYFDGIRNIMEWKYYDSPVYVYQHGAEDFPEGQEKYSITKDESGTFTLIVKNLGHQDAGIYTCDASGAAAKAVLLVLETPTLITPKPDPEEGQTVQYSCTAKFSGPSKSEIPQEQHPRLLMYFGGAQVEGTVYEKEEQDESRTRYEFLQVHNVTLQASMHGKKLTCDIGTSSPMKNVNYTTQAIVLYSVRTITYTPKNNQFEVGADISCIADGSPKPDFIWDDIKNAGKFIEGPLLKITEEMMGSNTWRCTARNTIGGRSHQKNIVADFSVVYKQEEENATDDSWKIAVAITIPICIVIGSLVAVLLYCQLKRKRPPPSNPGETDLMLHEKNSYSPPDSQLQVAGLPVLTIVCGKDGRKWEEEIRKICEEASRLGDVEGNAVKRYAVQTYSSFEKVEAKFKGFNKRTKNIDSEKLIIILSMGLKAHVMKYVDSLNSSPVWLPKATIIVDLPAHEIPKWFEKRNIEYINAQIYDDIGMRKKISESLFGWDITRMVKKNYSNTSNSERIQYRMDDISKNKFEKVGSVAEGLAWSYFLNYINLIGLTMGDRIREFENSHASVRNLIPKKLFILLPSSCFSSPKLQDADPAITNEGSLKPYNHQIAGNERRYETIVHKIAAKKKTYYACVEYCTPVLALYEMRVKGVISFPPEEMKAQLHVFYQLLETILEHPYFPQFCKDIKLVAYDDECGTPLSEILVKQIEESLGVKNS